MKLSTKLPIASAVLGLLIPVVTAVHRHHVCAASQTETTKINCKENEGIPQSDYPDNLVAVCAYGIYASVEQLDCTKYHWFQNQWHFDHWHSGPDQKCTVPGSEKSHGEGDGHWACVYN